MKRSVGLTRQRFQSPSGVQIGYTISPRHSSGTCFNHQAVYRLVTDNNRFYKQCTIVSITKRCTDWLISLFKDVGLARIVSITKRCTDWLSKNRQNLLCLLICFYYYTLCLTRCKYLCIKKSQNFLFLYKLDGAKRPFLRCFEE